MAYVFSLVLTFLLCCYICSHMFVDDAKGFVLKVYLNI